METHKMIAPAVGTPLRRSTVEPSVSICVPARNAEDFIEDAVESALRQVPPDAEVIVVDNCSSDATLARVRAMGAKDARLRVYVNERDLGLTGNFNRCLQYATGRYVTILCADDVLLPGFLAEMGRCLDANPQVSLAAAARLFIDGAGRPIASRRYATGNATVAGTTAIRRCLAGGNFIGEPSAVMFRRTLAARGFRADYSQLTDLEMWLHLLEQGDLAVVAAPLCAIRQHAGQLTRQNIRTGAIVEDNVRLYEEYRHKPYLRWTWRDSARHRVLMAWRVWMAGGGLSAQRRDAVLRAYASRWAYRLMPLAAQLLAGARALRRMLRIGTPRTVLPGK